MSIQKEADCRPARLSRFTVTVSASEILLSTHLPSAPGTVMEHGAAGARLSGSAGTTAPAGTRLAPGLRGEHLVLPELADLEVTSVLRRQMTAAASTSGA